MSRKPRGRADPIEHQIELALSPGTFIRDHACFSFVRGLEEVAARIGKLTGNDSARAIALCETFLAGCYEKVEELDDSSGSFGQFVAGLVCAWIKARQASDAGPDETAARLLAWMDDDPYGFCHGIEKDAVKVFDKAGLAAFEKQVRARFEATAKPPGNQPEHLRRHWSEVLRTLYLAQKDVAAYVALAGETVLTGRDCHAIATLLVTRRKPDEALAWVERGIDLGRKTPQSFLAGYGLDRLQRELLARLGRRDEALDAAWAAFREDPGKYSYDDLIKLVPKAERRAWHEKAMEAAKGADLHDLIELLLETKEIKRLAELVRGTSDEALDQLSHYATEPAAKKLEKTHADVAARLWRAQGMRIVNAGKSKYYEAALSNFERASRCYKRAGLTAGWEETVRQVRACHHRKTGFMSGFEALAAGSGPGDQPSFLERAKARWGGRQGRDNS
jgi:tetratricopeptide (TPR) repeat protein